MNVHILRVFISQKTKHLKLQNQDKGTKISLERGNSLRNKVREWLELDSPKGKLTGAKVKKCVVENHLQAKNYS